MRCQLEVGRYEVKYVLPASRRTDILELVTPYVRPDRHACAMGGGAVGYQVHSLYLDTKELTDYFERLEQRRVRNRLRTRSYGQLREDQPVFLEVKRKSGRWVVKHRVPVCSAETWCTTRDPRPWTGLARAVSGRGRYAAASFCQLVDGGRRQPVSVVHYQREVLVPREDDARHVRLTLDRRIEASVAPSPHHLFAPADVELIPPEWLVMELKFNGWAPRWMRELGRRLGIHPVPVSKFGLSVARAVRSGRERELRLLTPSPLRQGGQAA